MYDTKCRELAEAFLEDEPIEDRNPGDTLELAQIIQDAIESYLEDRRRRVVDVPGGDDL